MEGSRVKPIVIREYARVGSLAEFSAVIRDQREPEASARDNLRSLALTIAAVSPARRRAVLRVAEIG